MYSVQTWDLQFSEHANTINIANLKNIIICQYVQLNPIQEHSQYFYHANMLTIKNNINVKKSMTLLLLLSHHSTGFAKKACQSSSVDPEELPPEELPP